MTPSYTPFSPSGYFLPDKGQGTPSTSSTVAQGSVFDLSHHDSGASGSAWSSHLLADVPAFHTPSESSGLWTDADMETGINREPYYYPAPNTDDLIWGNPVLPARVPAYPPSDGGGFLQLDLTPGQTAVGLGSTFYPTVDAGALEYQLPPPSFEGIDHTSYLPFNQPHEDRAHRLNGHYNFSPAYPSPTNVTYATAAMAVTPVMTEYTHHTGQDGWSLAGAASFTLPHGTAHLNGIADENSESDEEPHWNCELCRRTFNRPADLERHEATSSNHAPPAFTCRECGRLFTRDDSRKAHMRKFHPGVSWTRE
ncbi:hypothetical protein EW146_g720 [Bondarzewia mesenterica]|uniref:C2H2-type domain-containing protein n=1 Tax=Bondarzewia mesenterica TaxID=1095465 RepID=A0A4S4M6J5_9AGAM|nr:hypothetical protein EW146_g720 [Bondarzewia mesenterica]